MSTIEKSWVTKSGLKAFVMMHPMGHRCGYVNVPEEHPLYGCDYNDPHQDLNGERPVEVFEVYGGLTFSRSLVRNAEEGWYFGFDCAHYGDAPDYEAYKKYMGEHFNQKTWDDLYGDGAHRTLDFCIEECEKLAQQLVKVKEFCEWEKDYDDGCYHTDCKRFFLFDDLDYTLKQHNYNFCPSCGKKIKEIENEMESD